jgi:ElaB/YqjD/DUF883 family membrane-anchored ribosome-binding protein
MPETKKEISAMQFGSNKKERLVKVIRNAMSELESLLGDTASDTGDSVSDMKERMRDSLGSARSTLSDFHEDATERARVTAYATDDYVRSHTWTTIGAAAALGVVIGLILNHRR